MLPRRTILCLQRCRGTGTTPRSRKCSQGGSSYRWGRLKNRYEVHQSCVNTVTGLLNNMDVTYSLIGREEMHRNVLADKDLVIEAIFENMDLKKKIPAEYLKGFTVIDRISLDSILDLV